MPRAYTAVNTMNLTRCIHTESRSESNDICIDLFQIFPSSFNRIYRFLCRAVHGTIRPPTGSHPHRAALHLVFRYYPAPSRPFLPSRAVHPSWSRKSPNGIRRTHDCFPVTSRFSSFIYFQGWTRSRPLLPKSPSKKLAYYDGTDSLLSPII
jgi:hypothetical protein